MHSACSTTIPDDENTEQEPNVRARAGAIPRVRLAKTSDTSGW